MDETIFLNRDNPVILRFKIDGKPLDFSAATRMTCFFSGSAVIADSNADGSLFDWSLGGGDLEFNFNDLVIAEGTYSAKLVVYDAEHPDGQIITHESGAKLNFKFVS